MGGSGENASTKSGEAVQQVEMQWDIEQKKMDRKSGIRGTKVMRHQIAISLVGELNIFRHVHACLLS